MGLSHAAAGAVIFFAAALAGFQVSGDAFDEQSNAADAWRDFHQHQQRLSDSSFRFDSFSPNGAGDVERTITLTNTGAVAIDGNLIDILADGAVVTITDRSVAGGQVDVWLPNEELQLKYTGTKPSQITIIDALGEKLVEAV